jgi:hypothetical protein
MLLRKNRLFSRRGNVVLDNIWFLVAIFMVAAIIFFAKDPLDDIVDDIQGSADISADAKAASATISDSYVSVWDGFMLFFYIMFIIGMLISVWWIDTHPIFFVISLFGLLMLFVAAVAMGESYEEMLEDDELGAIANQFSFTGWLMENIVLQLVAISLTVMIAMFFKMRYLR